MHLIFKTCSVRFMRWWIPSAGCSLQRTVQGCNSDVNFNIIIKKYSITSTYHGNNGHRQWNAKYKTTDRYSSFRAVEILKSYPHPPLVAYLNAGREKWSVCPKTRCKLAKLQKTNTKALRVPPHRLNTGAVWWFLPLTTYCQQQEEEGEREENAVGLEGVIWAKQQDDQLTHII